jgi:glycosyltransferase involved in cell wall biosynthesis
MKISVVIPTYNRAQFVGKAVASVLNQSFPSYEIIVIDDGSTDGTREALSRYAGKISYIYQNNSGVSSARNEGIKQSQGDWVAFLDSDDEWTRQYLFTQTMHARKFPQAIAHLTNAVTILSDGTRTNLFAETGLMETFKTAPCLFLARPLRLILSHASWFLQSAILRRDVLFKIGLFDNDLSIAEDIDIIARAALEGPFTLYRGEMVQVYRRHESMLNLSAKSFQNGLYRYKAFEKVYLKLLSADGLTALERIALVRALSRTKRALGNVLVLANRRIDARAQYRQSLFMYPSLGALIKVVATVLPGGASLALVRKGRDMLPGVEIQDAAIDLSTRHK